MDRSCCAPRAGQNREQLMKGKAIWIGLGILVVVLVIFFIWRSARQRQLQQQAMMQQQQQMMYGPGGTWQTQNQSGLAGTIDSVGNVIDSLTGLFSGIQSGGSGNGVDQATINAIANDCELMYNTEPEVQACIASKLSQMT